MARGQAWSEDLRKAAVKAVYETGSISDASKITGIPLRTIHDWIDTDWWIAEERRLPNAFERRVSRHLQDLKADIKELTAKLRKFTELQQQVVKMLSKQETSKDNTPKPKPKIVSPPNRQAKRPGQAVSSSRCVTCRGTGVTRLGEMCEVCDGLGVYNE